MRSRGRKTSAFLRLFLCTVFGAVLLLNLVPHTIFAADSGTKAYRAEWVDRAHIRVYEDFRGSEGTIFTDSNLDNTYHFVNLNQAEECRSSLSVLMNSDQQNYKATAPATAILYSVVKAASDANNASRCEVRYDKNGAHARGELAGTSQAPISGTGQAATAAPSDGTTKLNGGTVPLTKPGNAIINFRRVNDTSLIQADGSGTFTRFENSDTFLEPGDGACRDSIILNASKTVEGRSIETGTYRKRSGSGNPCKIDSSQPVAAMAADDPDAASLEAGGVLNNGDTTANCESSGFNLSWVFCPIINGLASTTDWIFQSFIVPFLRTNTINVQDTSSPIYQVWSNFRIIANILLVMALMVIVFGQSIGGGMIEAYTAKKVMPRLLVAAILINISIYLIAFAVDFTNILGKGIGQLLTSPFNTGDFLSFRPNFLVSFGGIAGFVVASYAIATAFGVIFSFLWVFVLMPALFAMIGVFVTLILRQGLILFLIIISPVAFALYCLPNTEKYFKKWWDLLFKSLLVYPIVVALFAVANILAVLVAGGNNTSLGRATLSQVAALVIMFMPLFLIPFAFKFAGGAVASLYGAISGFNKRGVEAIKGNANDPNSLRNRARHNLAAEGVKRRAQFVRTNKDLTFGGSGPVRKRGINGLRGLAGRGMNFGHVMNKEAVINKEGADRVDVTTNYGDDNYERARASIPLYVGQNGEKTVDKSQAQLDGSGRALRWKDDKGNDLRQSLNGQKEYTDNDYNKSKQLYKTMGEMQEAVWYEGKKARDLGHAEAFQDNYGTWAEQEGLTEEQAFGLLTGVGFKHQAKRKEWKYSKAKKEANGRIRVVRPHESQSTFERVSGPGGTVIQKKEGNADAFVSEAYSDMGSWTMSQEGDSTMREISRVKDTYVQTMQRLGGRNNLSDVEQAELNNARTQYKKIDAMESSWVADPAQARRQAAVMGVQPPSDDDGAPGYSGLSGAPQAVIDEARKMALRDATVQVKDANGNVTGTERRQVRNRYDDNGQLVKVTDEI